MKKKIAVFASGYNSENLSVLVEGMKAGFEENTADIFLFMDYADYSQKESIRLSELAIYALPHLEDFDAAVIFASGINFHDTLDDIYEACEEAEIPTISIGMRRAGTHYIGVDNYIGMQQLSDYVIEKGAENIKYIGGSKEQADSTVRLKALIDSMEAHGLQLTLEDIFFSNWDKNAAVEYVESLIDENNIPDAIVCANDMLAISVCSVLHERGIKVPQQVMVTGFDYTYEGRVFYPSVASVDQHFKEMGEGISQTLTRCFEGETLSQETIIETSFVPGESVWAENARNEEEIRREYARNITKSSEKADTREGRLHLMSEAIINARTYSNISASMQSLFYASPGIEGPSFYLMLDPRMSVTDETSISKVKKHRFGKSLDVIVAKENERIITDPTIETRDLIPGYTGEGRNRLFFFMPIYMEVFNCGYLVMCDRISDIAEKVCRMFQTRIIRSLLPFRWNVKLNAANSKLTEIMQTDELTCVRNKIAFDDYKKNLVEKYDLGERLDIAIAFFDVKNLRRINDLMGPEAGDMYIKNACKMICDTFKHSPVFRTSGDDFVAIVSNADYPVRDELMSKLAGELKEIEEGNLPMTKRISIGLGQAVYDERLDNSLEDTFRRAEELVRTDKMHIG